MNGKCVENQKKKQQNDILVGHVFGWLAARNSWGKMLVNIILTIIFNVVIPADANIRPDNNLLPLDIGSVIKKKRKKAKYAHIFITQRTNVHSLVLNLIFIIFMDIRACRRQIITSISWKLERWTFVMFQQSGYTISC